MNRDSMDTDTTSPRIRGFIETNFLFGASASFGDDVSLLETGVLDSTGVMELIAYLEAEFDLVFADDELLAENFDSINRITKFLASKGR